VRAAIITVNSTNDALISGPGERVCSLRDAIATANAQGGSPTGGCPTAASGSNTIVFGGIGSKITLTTDSELQIKNDIIIQGPGASKLTISGNNSGMSPTMQRVLEVMSGTVSISDLTIKGGNQVNGSGGGILVDLGATLNMTNCVISSNKAGPSGSGPFYGGGIENMGTLNLTNCTVTGNQVGFKMTGVTTPQAYGGGIDNQGTATLTGCTISNNKTIQSTAGPALSSTGGGINNDSGATLTVTNSTISGNKAAGSGGGLSDNSSGGTTLLRDTISGNTATGNGGGIVKSGSGLNVTNCTISGNKATFGGGLYNEDQATLLNCTIAGNTALEAGGMGGGGIYSIFGATTTVANTLIAFSMSTGGDCVGSVADDGNNLIDDATHACGLTSGPNNDIVGSAAELLPLAKNGGPTLTMALCTASGTPKMACTGASPAVAAGSATICAGAPVNNSDQRGFLRGAPTSCDIGAYEHPQ
jgi:CSLREA domain-containing protein